MTKTDELFVSSVTPRKQAALHTNMIKDLFQDFFNYHSSLLKRYKFFGVEGYLDFI